MPLLSSRFVVEIRLFGRALNQRVVEEIEKEREKERESEKDKIEKEMWMLGNGTYGSTIRWKVSPGVDAFNFFAGFFDRL